MDLSAVVERARMPGARADLYDMLKIGRMKKIKLSIKDQITYIENQLTPDIIA